MNSLDFARVSSAIQALKEDRDALPESIGPSDETVYVTAAMALGTRNLWDEYLYALGEHDPTRNEIEREYSQDERVLYAPFEPSLSAEVLGEMQKTEDVLLGLGIDMNDPYLMQISARRQKVASALTSTKA